MLDAEGKGDLNKGSTQRVASQRQKNKRLLRKAIKDGKITENDLMEFIRMKRTGVKSE